MKFKNLLWLLISILITGALFGQNSQPTENRKGNQPDLGSRSKTSLNVSPLSAGITVQQMVEAIIGEGVSYSNAVYTGATVASGLFSGGADAGIGIEEGIILSSGAAENAIGPNDLTGASQSNDLPDRKSVV